MKRLITAILIGLIGFSIFYTTADNKKVNASGYESLFASYSTSKFNNGGYYDAARAVYGVDGRIFSRMFDNRVDGYRTSGKVWVQTDRVYTYSGITYGLNQVNSPIFLAKDDRRFAKDYSGWSYCYFVR